MQQWERGRAGSQEFIASALGLSASAFTLLRDLVAERTGIFYGEGRQELLLDRVADLVAARGLPSLLDYYYLLKYDPQAEEAWAELRDRLAVPETYFWRQPDQFEALADVLMPRFEATLTRPLRIWSAASCTGEEPLSIAMALDQGGWFDRMQVEIVGSDASSALVAKARAGRYGERSMRNLPPGWLDRYFERDGTGWRIWGVRIWPRCTSSWPCTIQPLRSSGARLRPGRPDSRKWSSSGRRIRTRVREGIRRPCRSFDGSRSGDLKGPTDTWLLPSTWSSATRRVRTSLCSGG